MTFTILVALSRMGFGQSEVTIRGDLFLVIESASKVFRAHNPNIAGYNIVVMDEGSTLTVLFLNRNRPKAVVGNPGPLPEFEVHFDAKDLKILKAHFVR
ncbi:MAG: hypothetical protein HGB26_08435 [Desulfobulbaceae bacterium]|nr:hypothetical protein [Desulfobulbaceae bacterium]